MSLLRACPVPGCGSTRVSIVENHSGPDRDQAGHLVSWRHVKCENCEASGKGCWDNDAEAVLAWNDRPLTDALTSAVYAAESALELRRQLDDRRASDHSTLDAMTVVRAEVTARDAIRKAIDLLSESNSEQATDGERC